MADEEQFDEVLEELFALEEHGEIAEIERMEVHGALPVSHRGRKNGDDGIWSSTLPHPPEPHDHKPFVNPCHDALKPVGCFDRRWLADRRTHRRAAASAPPTSSAAIAWPSACSPTARHGQRNRNRAAGLQVRAHPFARSHRQDLRLPRPSANLPARRTDSSGPLLRKPGRTAAYRRRVIPTSIALNSVCVVTGLCPPPPKQG